MTAEGRSLSSIKFNFQRRKREGLLYPLPVHSWDTENRPGQPAGVLANEQRFFVTQCLDDCLQAMTGRKFERSLNTFWNMDYDIASIFKFEPDVLYELYDNQEAEYDNYKFDYIENKKFTIRKNKHKWSFYDVQQYFKQATPSLAGATRRYLKKEPDELKGDRDKLFDMYPIGRIGTYCQYDCVLTKELTEYLCSGLEGLGFIVPDLMSVGSVSRKYCNQYSNIPLLNYMPSLELIDAYYQSYRGGWFEICKRGRFNAWGYDIVSAYPAITRELPDIRNGEFVEIEDKEDLFKQDEYGCVLVRAVNKNMSVINPLSVQIAKGLFYPVLDDYEYKYITLREYRAFKRLYDLEIIKGWIFRPYSKYVTRPFMPVIDKLFEIKQSEKEAGRKDSAMYMTSKLIMNSIYGNTIQTTTKNDGETVTGGFFNPFYASEITAYCRVKMWEAIKDKLDSVIMIATDGVFTDRPLNIELDKALGGWDMEYEDEDAVFIGSGIYQFTGQESKGRGIGRQDFFSLLDTRQDKLRIVRDNQRVKVKEAIAQHRIRDVNSFETRVKEINLNGEISHRRMWEQEPECFRDLLNENYKSEAIINSFLNEAYGHRKVSGMVPFEPGEWLERCQLKKVI